MGFQLAKISTFRKVAPATSEGELGSSGYGALFTLTRSSAVPRSSPGTLTTRGRGGKSARRTTSGPLQLWRPAAATFTAARSSQGERFASVTTSELRRCPPPLDGDADGNDSCALSRRCKPRAAHGNGHRAEGYAHQNRELRIAHWKPLAKVNALLQERDACISRRVGRSARAGVARVALSAWSAGRNRGRALPRDTVVRRKDTVRAVLPEFLEADLSER